MKIASRAVRKVAEAFAPGPDQTGPALAGLVAELAEAEGLPPVEWSVGAVVAQNVAAEVAERTAGAQYPVFQVYCEKVLNRQREKFRRFSGAARMVVEARATQDRLEGLEARLRVYVEAVTTLLESRRGSWGEGVYFGGAYEITFHAVKKGGKNFLQTAKIGFDLEISSEDWAEIPD
jgi:hypothetical protein